MVIEFDLNKKTSDLDKYILTIKVEGKKQEVEYVKKLILKALHSDSTDKNVN